MEHYPPKYMQQLSMQYNLQLAELQAQKAWRGKCDSEETMIRFFATEVLDSAVIRAGDGAGGGI
jgi:hypothetical protein